MFSSLITRRLILRRLELSDAAKLYSYRAEESVARFQNWAPASEQEARERIARLRAIDSVTPGEWLQLGIALRETGELVGDCGLHARADERCHVDIGITLAPPAQGQGLASEAFAALLEFLFIQTETHRVFCSVDPENHRCLRLLERMGMRQEAHMKENLCRKGVWVDDVIFAILRREWHEEENRV